MLHYAIRWGKLRQHLARTTNTKFDRILGLNKACGSLEFDDDNHELNLVVQKDMNNTNSQTKDVKALR
jgi:hypothetical protein